MVLEMLDVVDWRITSQCNCSCEFCYASENRKALSNEDIMKIAEKICAIGVRYVCVSGGEPLLCPALPEVIKYFYEHGVKVFLSTNGSLYLERVDKIEPYIHKLSLPLDGYDAKSNTCGGRPEWAFDKVKEILDFYASSQSDLFIKVSTVLVKGNCNKAHLDKMRALLQKYNISQWKIYELVPEGRGADNYCELSVDYEKVVNDFIENTSENKFKITFVPESIRNSAYFIILSDGDVMVPAKAQNGYDEHVLGNILVDSIDDLKEKWLRNANYHNYVENLSLRK